MNTLLETMTFTKGMEYLIAIGFIIAFIAFWHLVYGKGKALTMRVAVVAYMVLGIAILVASCLSAAPR